MQIKHAWVQQPVFGTRMCPPPTSIAHRPEGRGHAWPQLMDEIEEVSRCLPNFALTVVNGSKMDLNRVQKDKAAVKWHSELEINLIGVILAPGLRRQVENQERYLRTKCAALIAKKVIALLEFAADSPIDMEINWGGSLIQAALNHLRDPGFVADNTSLPVKKLPEEAARDLVPNAIRFDSIGKPLTVLEAVTIDRPEEKTVDPPWEGWLNSVVTETVGQQHSAKLAFRQACLWANVHTDRTTHIALTSLGGVVSAVATEDIEIGGLIFPCFFSASYLIALFVGYCHSLSQGSQGLCLLDHG